VNMSSSPSIAHFINPYETTNTLERRVHELTLLSIDRASAFVEGEIQKVAVVHEDDEVELSQSYVKALLPNRSFRDKGFPQGKRYPFIKDMFDAAIHSSNAEYFIYTNMDIILQPSFYRFVIETIDAGHDAFIINRRRISKHHLDDDLDTIIKIKGKPHPGFDCFVFHRDLYHKMHFGEIVHATFIGVTIAHNIFCYAKRPVLFDDQHLTTHIGMEILRPKNDAYWYNRHHFFKDVKNALWSDLDIRKFPYANLPFYHRYLKWALNPSLFTFMNFKLELRAWLGLS
jgi:hypothetical protein